MKRIDRRQLGKGIVGGVAAGMLGALDCTQAIAVTREPVPQSADWNEVMPGVWKATLGHPDPLSPVQTRLVSPKTRALTELPRPAQPPIIPPAGRASARGISVELPLEAKEEIYGFGLQFLSFRQRGKKKTVRVNADPRVDTGDSHAPVPFYVTSLGYGILVDTFRYASFYCGEVQEKPEQAVHTTESATMATSTSELYTAHRGSGRSTKMLVDVPSCSGVDIYLFAGPTMLEAVQRYNLFSGGGVLPPEWGLGFWYRAEANATASDITDLTQEFRSRRIPCDVIGLEPGWQTHAYSCSFVWNNKRFPQPREFVRRMQGANLHVNLWEHAFVHPSSPLFAPIRELSGDKAVWGGLVPDFQDPRARRAFGDYHGEALIDMGIDGFKLDECDNSDYTNGWSFPELSRFPSGVDGEQMHSIFGLRYQKALWDQYTRRNQATYSLVRSSGALASPYPFVLYSDLYNHRQFVRALVNSGFSGLLWCPEVRDAANEEDFLRRLQTVVFSPLAMINAWYIRNPPWKQLDRDKNNAGALDTDWKALEDKCRTILGWRMQLIPYLRSAFAAYAEHGIPPFRAPALDWPNDPALAAVDDAWMVGDRMLVAPLFAGETAGRSLVLPPGGWHDFWTGAFIAGGSTIALPATTPDVPVFVKTGSVFPLATVTGSVAEPESKTLTVKVFGDGHLPLELKSGDLYLKLAWDASMKRGSVTQTGKTAYRISSWLSV